QGRADRGEPLEVQPDLAFGFFAQEWLGRAERRIRGVETTRNHLRNHLLPAFGRIGLRQLSPVQVNRWIAQRLASPKPSTVQREFNTLRAILNDAVRSGLIEKSPTANADPIRGAVARQRFLTNEELTGLLVIAADHAEWLPDFILWAVHSG